MDISGLTTGDALLSVAHEVVELSSSSDSGEDEVASRPPPMTLKDLDRGKPTEKLPTAPSLNIEDSDDSEVEWEEDSIMDDVIEELSDEDLRRGGT